MCSAEVETTPAVSAPSMCAHVGDRVSDVLGLDAVGIQLLAPPVTASASCPVLDTSAILDLYYLVTLLYAPEGRGGAGRGGRGGAGRGRPGSYRCRAACSRHMSRRAGRGGRRRSAQTGRSTTPAAAGRRCGASRGRRAGDARRDVLRVRHGGRSARRTRPSSSTAGTGTRGYRAGRAWVEWGAGRGGTGLGGAGLSGAGLSGAGWSSGAGRAVPGRAGRGGAGRGGAGRGGAGRGVFKPDLRRALLRVPFQVAVGGATALHQRVQQVTTGLSDVTRAPAPRADVTEPKHIDNKPRLTPLYVEHIAPPDPWSLELNFHELRRVNFYNLYKRTSHTKNANELDFS